MSTHNWHNLSHYGLRGHEHHQRLIRNQRLMERAGAVLVALFLVTCLIASCAPLVSHG